MDLKSKIILTCIKCGNEIEEKIAVTWVPAIESKKLGNGLTISRPIEEKLHCQCLRCGYSWDTITKEQDIKQMEELLNG